MLATLSHYFIEANHYFNTQISHYFELIDEGDWKISATIFAFSFAYGVIHALGPGHGKALLSGYLLAHPNVTTTQVFRIGFFIALVHALSALILTLSAVYILDISATKLLGDVNIPLMRISGGLIVLMGGWLLYEILASSQIQEKIRPKKELSVVVLSGIVPCPGVMTVSFFAMSLGEISTGIFAALFMSLGMGMSISIVGLIAHRFGHTRIITRQPLWFLCLRILGALIVMGIGVLLFFNGAKTKPF